MYGYFDRCPTMLVVAEARKRAGELGIKTVKGTLLYIAERLQAQARLPDEQQSNVMAYLDTAKEILLVTEVHHELAHGGTVRAGIVQRALRGLRHNGQARG